MYYKSFPIGKSFINEQKILPGSMCIHIAPETLQFNNNESFSKIKALSSKMVWHCIRCIALKQQENIYVHLSLRHVTKNEIKAHINNIIWKIPLIYSSLVYGCWYNSENLEGFTRDLFKWNSGSKQKEGVYLTGILSVATALFEENCLRCNIKKYDSFFNGQKTDISAQLIMMSSPIFFEISIQMAVLNWKWNSANSSTSCSRKWALKSIKTLEFV